MGCTCDEKETGVAYPQTNILASYGSEQQIGPYAENINTRVDAFIKSQVALHEQLVRIARQTYDKSRPVDEYQFIDSPTLYLQWLADYAIAERIESITASLPVGITSAKLQLGQRIITLYSGAATTVQTMVTLQDMGIILNESDNRNLTMLGAPTTGCYVALAGFCLERVGNR